MDTGLVVEQTENMADVMAVLTDPVIYDCISDDYSPDREDFKFEHTNQEFIVGKVDDHPVALMIFYPGEPGWHCHVQVIPKYRSYALEFGAKALKWFWKTHDVANLYAIIPEKYPNVSKFAEKNGFRKEKQLGDIYMKDGVAYNENRYRLERDQWGL